MNSLPMMTLTVILRFHKIATYHVIFQMKMVAQRIHRMPKFESRLYVYAQNLDVSLMSGISTSLKGSKFTNNWALQKFPQLNEIKGLLFIHDVANQGSRKCGWNVHHLFSEAEFMPSFDVTQKCCHLKEFLAMLVYEPHVFFLLLSYLVFS